METVLYFFVHYGVLAAIVVWMHLYEPASRLGRLLGLVAGLSVCVFLFLWGQWALVGSIYFRPLPVVVAAWVAIARNPLAPGPWLPTGWLPRLGILLLATLTLAPAFLAVSAVKGMRSAATAVDLAFPLRDGTFYVSSGGSTKAVNNHIRPFPTDQQFAIDLHRLDPLGRAARVPASANNADHFIFGWPVVAACAGTVVAVKDGVVDNAGHTMDVSPDDGRGNSIDIDCDGLRVSYSHLMEGSVLVAPGDGVEADQPLAAVGNSGFSEEPHLHFQAARADDAGDYLGVAMRFGRDQLVRNSVYETGSP